VGDAGGLDSAAVAGVGFAAKANMSNGATVGEDDDDDDIESGGSVVKGLDLPELLPVLLKERGISLSSGSALTVFEIVSVQLETTTPEFAPAAFDFALFDGDGIPATLPRRLTIGTPLASFSDFKLVSTDDSVNVDAVDADDLGFIISPLVDKDDDDDDVDDNEEDEEE